MKFPFTVIASEEEIQLIARALSKETNKYISYDLISFGKHPKRHYYNLTDRFNPKEKTSTTWSFDNNDPYYLGLLAA